MKNFVGVVVIVGDNLPSPVGIGLNDLPNIEAPPGPPGSGITAMHDVDPSDSLIIRSLEWNFAALLFIENDTGDKWVIDVYAFC